MKKVWVFLMVGMMCFGLLNTSVEATKKVELRYLTCRDFTSDAPRDRVLRETLDSFHKQYPNIRVKIDTVPKPEIYHLFGIQYEAGNSPDILLMGQMAVFPQILTQRVMPLNRYMSEYRIEKFKSANLQQGTYKGKAYVQPDFQDCTAPFFYRKDLFEKAGLDPNKPPRYWDEVIEYGKKLVNPPRQWGFGFIAARHIATVHNWMSTILQAGGKMMDEEGRAVYNSPEGVKALTYYTDCIRKYRITPEGVLAQKHMEIERGFIAGTYPMAVMVSEAYSRTVSALGKDRIGYARFPIPRGGKDVIGAQGWSYMIPKSKNPDAAWTFISYFTSDITQDKINRTQTEIPITPYCIEAAYLDAFIRFCGEYDREAGVGQPKSAYLEDFYYIMVESMQKAFRETLTPKEALDEGVRRFNTKYELE